MNRLLQGEVGSGKTVVAEYAMLLAVAHSHQSVLMAPTEVLAQQHFRTLSEDLQQSRVRMDLLTGALTGTPRQQLLDRVQAGEVDLLIGTQALLHEEIQFPQLGLVVIDEQHKFGVRQRAALKSTGCDPHYLVMTATPIPRTVAMSLFGDLDVSTLRESPPGRQQVYTYLATEDQRDTWWKFVRRKLQEGRQGIRDYAARGRKRVRRTGQRRRGLRATHQRPARSLSSRLDPRPLVLRGQGSGHGRVSAR